MRLLLVEDDAATAAAVARGLQMRGYHVDVSSGGSDALLRDHDDYDAAIIDLSLGDAVDGVDVCRTLRERGFWGAVLIVTARAGVHDRVLGLDAGADDYIAKPFTLIELAARVRAHTRRPPDSRPVVLGVGDLTLDPASMRCWRGGVEIELTRREFAVLQVLMRHPGQVLTRGVILTRAWEDPDAVDSNVVDQTVRYLRRKIDLPFGLDEIQTVRGVGYRLHASGSRRSRSRGDVTPVEGRSGRLSGRTTALTSS
ncbi:response regulator transcription factor [Phycicoccus flavus]|uniref:response regulator transcription factor n=1 Tax=Phycicoccus flavus TaxID=2502783 RepID=UPI000FEBEB3F|nr:response regulator transcription factor [Phycicoccus flavus]NHA68613.1 response regulator transcription factor [Phycicoccus flavus]NHA68688.1 response regulator transcription factor [Phycicoccus flavus]